MKKKFIIYLLAAIAITGCKNNAVTITGTLINPVEGEYLYLDELKTSELTTIDSIKISEKGTFSFTRKVENPSFYLLKINENNFLTLLLAPGENIKMSGYFDSLNYPQTISGSIGSELMAQYNITLRQTINKLTELNNIYMQNADSPDLPAVIESLDSMAQGYLSEINSYTKDYIDDNLSSLASLVALYQQVAPSVYVLNPTTDFEYFLKVDSSMTSLYPEYEPVVSLHEQVEEMKASLKGEMAPGVAAGQQGSPPEIALPTPEGDTIRLSSTRGSVVLLDFWAAWCAPCRMENPNLVKAYDLYHKKGFQIFQVSLDKTKEAWVKGIKDDKLEKWIHVSDIKYWNSIVVPLYNIESIPTNYLLDKNGQIIASNLRGEQLLIKLAEIFNK